jgi:hypothetical protein
LAGEQAKAFDPSFVIDTASPSIGGVISPSVSKFMLAGTTQRA